MTGGIDCPVGVSRSTGRRVAPGGRVCRRRCPKAKWGTARPLSRWSCAILARASLGTGDLTGSGDLT